MCMYYGWLFFYLRSRGPPISSRTDTLLPYQTLFRSEPADLGVGVDSAQVAADDPQVEHEGNRPDQHDDAHRPLDAGVVEVGERSVVVREAAGCDGGHGMGNRIEAGHAERPQQIGRAHV